MKKKFLRGVAAFLAVMMMLPTAAFADVTEGENAGDPVVVDTEGGEPTPPEPAEPTEITIAAAEEKTLYSSGDSTSLQLKIAEENVNAAKVTWTVLNGDDVVSVSSSGLITAKKAGTATIRATYNTSTDVLHDDYSVTVEQRGIIDFKVEETTRIDRYYFTGESFDKDGIEVYIKYNDKDTWIETENYTLQNGDFQTAGTVTVVVGHAGIEETYPIEVEVVDVAVESVKIKSPANNHEVAKNASVDSVTVEVTYNNGEKSEVTATKTDKKGITFTGYNIGDKITADVSIAATYGGKTSDPVIIKVKEEAPAQSAYTVVLTKNPNALSYTVGQSLNLTGLTFDIYKNGTLYRNMTAANLSSYKYTFTSADVGTTSKVINFTFDSTQLSLTITGLTVTKGSNVTGLKNSSSYYELQDKSDIELKVGDKLNDDIYWYDIFDEVYLIVDGANKKIDSKSDLEEYPGVELLLKVYNKSSDSEEIEASDIRNDGTVYLQLYVKNGDNKITSTSYSIREYIPVTEAECTVYIYSTKSYTSSTTPKATAVFSDIYEALEALVNDDSDEFEDAFGASVSLGSNYAILIKLGEDQAISKSDVFEPEHHVPVIIDLNGNELSIYAEKWISYDEDDDFELTVTNTNTKNDGSIVYKDKSLSLVVATGSQLVFSEGKIPTDTDAACTVTIQRSSTSSTVIATKVYDDLADAFEAFEEKDEIIENFDVPSSYEDTFVLKIKLGDDQNLGSFKFAPDYETTISIDLNGYELKLKSDWIDYDDCEDLVISVNNTNADEKGTLTYSDKTTSALVAKGDTALKFEEGKIPGLYKVEIGTVTNGKVTVNPNKTAIGKGNNVTFTITPNAGYEISSVKNGTKNITSSTSGYTVDSKGVATYKVENIAADIKLDVTFKKTSSASSSSSSSSSAANWNNPFTDVTTNAQYYEAVAFVCNKGLFNGMTATKFEPYTTMTRAMFVTVLGRLAGINEMLYSGTSFTDVSKNDAQIAWAAPYIEWAVQKGITNGTGNGKFSPNEPITHQQMYLFMQRYADKIANVDTSTTGVNLSGIRDAAQIADWAEDGVKFASKYGILITSDSKLTPTENALRCELAMLLHGFCVKVLEQ